MGGRMGEKRIGGVMGQQQQLGSHLLGRYELFERGFFSGEAPSRSGFDSPSVEMHSFPPNKVSFLFFSFLFFSFLYFFFFFFFFFFFSFFLFFFFSFSCFFWGFM